MEAFNSFFKDLAKKMHLPEFFERKPVIFNNLFLTLAILILLIALLLIIFLVPGRKKRKAKKAARLAASTAANGTEDNVFVEEQFSEQTILPAAVEEAPAEENVTELAENADEEAPAEEAVVESAAAPAEEEKVIPVEETEEPVVESEKKAAPVKEVAADSDKEESFRNGGKYEIVRRRGSYFFLLKANNGQLLLESTSYTTEAGAKKAIDTFKKAVEVGEFNIDEDKNGNFKFILRASARSQMLYHGESYGTRQSAENAIQSVKNFAFKSIVHRAVENDIDDEAPGASVVTLTPLDPADHKLGGKYEIVGRGESYYFLLKANNGQLLVESPAFTTEAGAKAGIESFKKAAESGIFMIDQDKNGNFRFILRASARSQLRYFGESYSTRQSAENSVNSVRCFAQKAVLK